MVKWYSLFSHTGKETETLWRLMNGKVELKAVLTTNYGYKGDLPRLKCGPANFINQWLLTPGNVEPDSIVTLNGYMRILPENVIEYLHSIGCKVLNIHPAPIQLYPDLRGKDPQERLYNGIKSGEYTYIGVVIHNVDTGVDTGSIVNWRIELADPSMPKEYLYEHLHEVGTEMWVEVLEEYANGQSH